MKAATQRSVIRWIHIALSIPILGYIFTPFEDLHYFANRVRFVVVPLIVLSGLWMWKGHIVRRLISRTPARQGEPAKQLAEHESVVSVIA